MHPSETAQDCLGVCTLCLVLLGGFSKIKVIKECYAYTKYCLFIISLRCHNLLTERTNFHPQILALHQLCLGPAERESVCFWQGLLRSLEGSDSQLVPQPTSPKVIREKA